MVMWDYDKLFAKGNIIGIKKPDGEIYHIDASAKQRNVGVLSKCYNDSLSFDTNNGESFIQYIMRLDEHGNVVEKLFDRERDMVESMPELKTGMFVRVAGAGLGYVNVENNRIIYQNGDFDYINYYDGVYSDIIEVYSKEVYSFNDCSSSVPLWCKKQYFGN